MQLFSPVTGKCRSTMFLVGCFAFVQGFYTMTCYELDEEKSFTIQFTSSGSLQREMVFVYWIMNHVGMLILHPLSDRVGRVPVLKFGTMVACCSTLATVFCTTRTELILMRGVSGFGMSVFYGLILVYAVEIIPNNLRSTTFSITGICICAGHFAAALATYFTSTNLTRMFIAGRRLAFATWQVIIFFSFIPLLLVTLTLWSSTLWPETPDWLDGQGRNRDANVIRAAMGGDTAGPVVLSDAPDDTAAMMVVEENAGPLDRDKALPPAHDRHGESGGGGGDGESADLDSPDGEVDELLSRFMPREPRSAGAVARAYKHAKEHNRARNDSALSPEIYSRLILCFAMCGLVSNFALLPCFCMRTSTSEGRCTTALVQDDLGGSAMFLIYGTRIIDHLMWNDTCFKHHTVLGMALYLYGSNFIGAVVLSGIMTLLWWWSQRSRSTWIFGRRGALLCGTGALIFCLLPFVAVPPNTRFPDDCFGKFIGMCAFLFIHGGLVSPTLMIYVTEIFPFRVRSRAVS